jgi:hypothetical protein
MLAGNRIGYAVLAVSPFLSLFLCFPDGGLWESPERKMLTSLSLVLSFSIMGHIHSSRQIASIQEELRKRRSSDLLS